MVVQKMHLMLKIHHYMLGLCKLMAQVPLNMVLHGAHSVGPVSFHLGRSGTVVCKDPLAHSCGRLGMGGLQLLPQSYYHCLIIYSCFLGYSSLLIHLLHLSVEVS